MPVAEITLPGLPSSAPTARHFVESLLTAWGQPDLGWTAALCVSELAGNAALHARTRFTVVVSCDGPDAPVRLTVSDESPRVPSMRDYGNQATTGRGLRMVDELASSWGVDLVPTGKSVWLVLAPAAAGQPDLADAELDVEALLAGFEDDGAPAPPSESNPSVAPLGLATTVGAVLHPAFVARGRVDRRAA